MDDATLRFIELFRHVTLSSLQMARDYQAQQAALQLDRVLQAEQLGSVSGTAASLDTLAALSALTARHRAAFETFRTTAGAEVEAAIAAHDPPLGEEMQTGLVRSIRRQFEAQSDFYANRERWRQAAEAICRLIERRRSGGADARTAAADEAELTRLLHTIENTHLHEVGAVEERMTRLADSMTALESAWR